MSEDRYGLFPINNNPNSDFDVIFIHGLGGDKDTTWQNSNNESWQQWLAADYNVSVWTIGYGANKTNWIEDDMSLEDAASYFLGTLKSKGIGSKPYMFVVHSLGGLLVKHILLKANVQKDYQKIVDNCKSIVFFAVPHTGSGWASLLDYAKPILRNSNLLKALPRGSSYLNTLVSDFNGLVNYKHMETYIFYETKELRKSGILGLLHLKKGSKIVSQESATHVHTNNPMVALPEDHISICKINAKTSDTYANRMKMIMSKMMKITNNIKEDKKQKEESAKKESERDSSSKINVQGDYVDGNKYVHNDRSVKVKGSNTGTIITGDNNKIS